jgi:hypothetical protein
VQGLSLLRKKGGNDSPFFRQESVARQSIRDFQANEELDSVVVIATKNKTTAQEFRIGVFSFQQAPASSQVFEDNAIGICMPLHIMTLCAQTLGGKQNEDAGAAQGAGRAGARELDGKTQVAWVA